jgi:predicted TIM-barrel fold metal-dependent hydrolase
MADELTAPPSERGGTSDRREFLTGIAALTAGAVISGSRKASAQTNGAVPRRIDFHHHYQSPGLTKFLDSYGIRVPQFDREPLTRSAWTPEIGIEGMQKYGIDLAYTSAATYFTRTARLTKVGANIYAGDTMRRLARETNEYGARICADSKGRFRLFAVIPQTDIDGSLKEIEYALDTLKAPGFCMGTSVGTTYLGNKKLDPILEELNRRKAVVYTHPNEPDWSVDLVPGVNAANVWYGNDTTLAITSLIASGAPKTYPDIKWIFSHAGGTLPFTIQRVVGEPVAPKLNGTPKPGDRLYYLRNNFFYDTAQSANAAAMPALKVVAGVSRILFGTDYPWSTIDVDVDGMTDAGVFTAAELNAIYRENGLRLLPL